MTAVETVVVLIAILFTLLAIATLLAVAIGVTQLAQAWREQNRIALLPRPEGEDDYVQIPTFFEDRDPDPTDHLIPDLLVRDGQLVEPEASLLERAEADYGIDYDGTIDQLDGFEGDQDIPTVLPDGTMLLHGQVIGNVNDE